MSCRPSTYGKNDKDKHKDKYKEKDNNTNQDRARTGPFLNLNSLGWRALVDRVKESTQNKTTATREMGQSKGIIGVSGLGLTGNVRRLMGVGEVAN